MSSPIRELRELTGRGSLVELAACIVIGLALAKFVDSAVSDILVPILAGLLGKADFSQLFIPLASPPAVPPTLEALRKAGVPIIAYGNFLVVAINLVLVAFAMLFLVRQMNRMHRAGGTSPSQPAEETRPAARNP
jgi:large conductance mechanosensitive channel